jgi:hypothetical protein
MDELNSTVGIVALAAGAVAILALLLCAFLAMRLRRVRGDQRYVLGDRKEDLVEHAAELARQVEDMQDALAAEVGTLRARLAEAERRLDGSVSKTAVLRYDAFSEGTGRQSSTVALLDDRDTGVVISAILQREQARVYAKPVVEGASPLDLSPEELEAMQRARSGPEAE